MPPPRRTGLNSVTRRRPDGSTFKVYYDRRTGANLGTDRDKAIAAAIEYVSGPAPGSFDALCAAYLKDGKFKRLKPKSQSLNQFYVDRLRKMYGPLPASAITRPVVVALREKHAARPWYATHLLSKLRIVLQHGVDVGILRINPALKPGGVRPPRRHAVWSREATSAMLEAASLPAPCSSTLLSGRRMPWP